tara:strand:+ start:1119 stop:1496 length:378 start_codon:yes stop_codon:yes gene_type:complete
VIYGVGTDICMLSRIESMKSLDVFAEKILSDNEKKTFLSKDETQKIKFLGLQFAAKEAFVKALGTGFKKPIMPNQISILRNNDGKPIIEFDESIKSFINDLGIKSSHVSLSDDGGYAVAFVVLEA